MENSGYLYCTTHKPTGLMYVGSRKGDPDGDSYLGSPAGKNQMRELFDTRDRSEFEKDVLFVSDYDSIVSDEPGLIKAMQDEYGGLVTNIMTNFPPPPMYGEDHHKHWLGKTHSEESKAKRSASMSGQTVSAETRAKLSTINTGKTHSAETKAKLSTINTGKNHSAETKAKMSASHTGKVRTVEHCANLSATAGAKPGANRGADSHTSKTVINTKTGERWGSTLDADRKLGLAMGSTSSRVRNKTHKGIWQYA